MAIIINKKYNQFNNKKVDSVEVTKDDGIFIDGDMDLNDMIDDIKSVEDEETRIATEKYNNKQLQLCCSNFWCKAIFFAKRIDIRNNPEYYRNCDKCRSFNIELSAGVVDNGIKNYPGERFDNKTHEVKITTGRAFK